MYRSWAPSWVAGFTLAVNLPVSQEGEKSPRDEEGSLWACRWPQRGLACGVGVQGGGESGRVGEWVGGDSNSVVREESGIWNLERIQRHS